ncbi:hypothetical protein G6L37_02535 [Agrobacterium rubi]|nr:hypothetical protein [Agrobacterium rubi]NTF24273.1 hypothetical protein [Agrobacterium rubi]
MTMTDLSTHAFHLLRDVVILALLGLASSVVFVALFAAAGMTWQVSAGAGVATGFLSLLALASLPSTGIASTVCAVLVLLIYVIAATIWDFNAPTWVPFVLALAGFLAMPMTAAASLAVADRRQ